MGAGACSATGPPPPPLPHLGDGRLSQIPRTFNDIALDVKGLYSYGAPAYIVCCCVAWRKLFLLRSLTTIVAVVIIFLLLLFLIITGCYDLGEFAEHLTF